MTPQQWLRYWKKSLLDSIKTDIDLTKSAYVIEIENFNIKYAQITQISEVNQLIDNEEKRINAKRNIKNRDDKKWLVLESVQVLISPFQLSALPEHGVFTRDKKPFFPFWYYATLTREGELKVPQNTTPVIPRKHLAPIASENVDYTLSSIEAVDKASPVEKEQFETYEDYIKYIFSFFKDITEQDLRNYRTDFFKTLDITHITVPEEEIGAAINIVNLYEKLLNETSLPPLISDFISLENRPFRSPIMIQNWLTVNSKHLGQMHPDFPLSFSQRKGLYTLLDGTDRILAVNGPPGTGKTTFLQSIIATEMVSSALEESGNPHITLACSANNQAVTNIIDSFSKGGNGKNIRWLPDLEGYATYLPSATKSAGELENINYLKPDGEGLFSRIESPEYIREAKEFYLQQAKTYFEKEYLSLQEIAEALRSSLKNNRKTLETGKKLWVEYQKTEQLFEQKYKPSFADAKDAIEASGLLNVDFIKGNTPLLKELEGKILDNFRKESSFRRLGCWLKLKHSLNNRKAELHILYRNATLETAILPQFIYTQSEVLEQVSRLIETGEKISQSIEGWCSWKTPLGVTANPPLTTKEAQTAFFDELDIRFRYPAFINALHYWEARWLLAMEQFLLSEPSERNKRGEEASKDRWARRAMLTPCFVSTFYMAPKFFTYSKYLGKDDQGKSQFDYEPLLDFVDNLIVDEAGQVPPEAGVATLALAKRAIIVGDVKQIEPVWNITPKIDLGNLKQEGLIADYNDLVYEKEYHPKGFLSSTGSLMQMAQNACNRKEKNCPEKGVILVEHRRCYNEIIRYCSELAYHSVLCPLRGEAPSDNLFPPMYCIPVDGHSEVNNKMRYNVAEIDAICQWLQKNRERITEHYPKLGDIEDIVGIITPFVGQKNRLQKVLRKAGFDVSRMKLGTVHALQGAERPIILFSMVYGEDDCGTMFFDRDNKPNMLNVAVSRAKDSFIVFANTTILDKTANTPSGILARHLTYRE